ncbi:MAG: SDR family oxidoreductase [Bryobacteraceae bacterium]|nr:SDR family oxidoreductase [Bryobacteraceae bacterium]
MNVSLLHKNAVVTGGTRGIGFAIAEALLQAGASVAICGRSESDVDRAVKELAPFASQGNKVVGRPADVTRREQVSEFFQFVDASLDHLDILINNAGVGVFANIAELTPEQWKQVIDTNLNGVYFCSREAIPRFRNRGGGFIINISSLAGKNAFSGGTAYNASKFALNGFSEAMMLDVRYDNIRVSTIMPGSVATNFGSGGAADWKIAPEDIADVVLMVLSMPERTLISSVEIRPSKPKK